MYPVVFLILLTLKGHMGMKWPQCSNQDSNWAQPHHEKLIILFQLPFVLHMSNLPLHSSTTFPYYVPPQSSYFTLQIPQSSNVLGPGLCHHSLQPLSSPTREDTRRSSWFITCPAMVWMNGCPFSKWLWSLTASDTYISQGKLGHFIGLKQEYAELLGGLVQHCTATVAKYKLVLVKQEADDLVEAQ